MDIGTIIVCVTSAIVAGGVLIKLISSKPNKYVRKEVCASEHSALKELVQNGFTEINRRLGLIEQELHGRS